MTGWRRLVAGVTLIVGGTWLATSFDLISVSPRIFQALWTAFLLLSGLGIVMDWRSRKDQPHKEPSPARSAVWVIAATGAVAVLVTVRNAHSPSEYILPGGIAVITALLAVAAFRFASKNQDQIGEARFNTTSNGS